MLPLIMPLTVCRELKASFSFTWCRTSLKYLGVQLSAYCNQLYTCNHAPLFSTIRVDLQRWDRTTFSSSQCLSVSVKINVLSRILFHLQMVPISLPRYFFSTLNSLFIKYIWNGKSLHLAFHILQRPKRAGVMDVPNHCKYYEAIALQRILDWYHSVSTKIWVTLKKMLAGRNLSHAPRLPREGRGLSELTSPTTIHALKMFSMARNGLPLNYLLSLPLEASPGSLQGNTSPFSDPGRLMERCAGADLYKTMAQYGSFPMDDWCYRQIQHLLRSLPQSRAISHLSDPIQKTMYVIFCNSPFHLGAVWDVAVIGE